MKKALLLSLGLIVMHFGFSQPWTASPPLLIQASNPNSSGLFIQGQNANTNANLSMEGLGTAQIFWLTAANNFFKIGGTGGSEPGMGAINIDYLGNVGVSTMNTTGYKFAVAGSAIFTKAVVKLQANWPDYVFHKDYQLPSLESVAAYIKEKSYLPGIPAAEDIEKNGVDLGATQAKLLEKIEQLTLYTIELQKQVNQLKEQNATLTSLQQQINELKSANTH